MNAALGSDQYTGFARRLMATGLVKDPWIDGHARFSQEPFVLSADEANEVAGAAASVAAVYDELVHVVAREPALMTTFFALTPIQQALFAASAPLWHGYARADVFRCRDGSLKICELNCDTPSGFSEAIALGRAVRTRSGLEDPNQQLGAAFVALIASLGARSGTRPSLDIGIVYPTELTEDLSLVELWRALLEERGHRVVLGSPFNLQLHRDGRAALFGRPCDVIVRHYKTDWWGERRPIWDDEEDFPDSAPLVEPLQALLEAQLSGATAVVNPFASVLPQNKRAMAFFWEQRERFSPESRGVIERLIPRSVRLEACERRQLVEERARWVLKSDYGCEGDEVLVGALCDDAEWAESLERALPGRWMVQERFDSRRDAHQREANHGVYLVAGEPAGIYTRLSSGPTSVDALSVPTLVGACDE